ncbi:hypothetical protein DSO57_1030361 [Entomophthora muscae]|uniref:Uncharacterized protein n=1 Tax=Entomophthora muscae TaxID=34485 RepID=A0ACC2T159_9FUNG|nr:hypothetical protein DSO57_1030361 [Entomophthora muscae]
MAEALEKRNDYFSKNSRVYSQGRPSHPPELFDYLVSLVPEKGLAWDVACGNGQAALQLARSFLKVKATDLSSQQLQYVIPRENIEYFTESAEEPNSSLFEPSSVDLITIAVGIHWFPHKEFYARVSKVLKPGGIIACWGYNYPRVNSEVDQVMFRLENDFFKPYDPPEFKHIVNEYSDLPWPFKYPENAHVTPDGIDRSFFINKSLNLEQYCLYLKSRSTAQLYIEKEGKDAVDLMYSELLKAWGNDPSVFRDVKWSLFLRVGCL